MNEKKTRKPITTLGTVGTPTKGETHLRFDFWDFGVKGIALVDVGVRGGRVGSVLILPHQIDGVIEGLEEYKHLLIDD